MSKKLIKAGEKTYSATGVLRNFSGKLICISNYEQSLPDILAKSFGTLTMSRWVFKKFSKLNLFFDGVALELYYVPQILVTTGGFELRPVT